MRISNEGLELIKDFEGCRLYAYKCPAGVWTIGYGHTKGVKSGQTITSVEAIQLLKEDVAVYENKVAKYDVFYHWKQNEFDALVSFAYNIGSIDQLTGKGLRSRAEIVEHWCAYNKANGKELAGLTRRRKAELALFEKVIERDEEMVEDSKVIVNGKEIAVKRILKDGVNYVAVRTLASAMGATVTAQGNIAVITTKE